MQLAIWSFNLGLLLEILIKQSLSFELDCIRVASTGVSMSKEQARVASIIRIHNFVACPILFIN
jgi:hypothetical protein